MRFVTGAPGAGKTVVAGLAATRLPRFAVLDMDALLDPVEAVTRVDLRSSDSAFLWPAYNDLWVGLCAFLAQRQPVLLFGPLLPTEVDVAPLASRLGAVEWAMLDCSDANRRTRLLERGYDDADIDEAISDALAARSLGLHAISTNGVGPEETADEVANWAMHGAP